MQKSIVKVLADASSSFATLMRLVPMPITAASIGMTAVSKAAAKTLTASGASGAHVEELNVHPATVSATAGAHASFALSALIMRTAASVGIPTLVRQGFVVITIASVCIAVLQKKMSRALSVVSLGAASLMIIITKALTAQSIAHADLRKDIVKAFMALATSAARSTAFAIRPIVITAGSASSVLFGKIARGHIIATAGSNASLDRRNMMKALTARSVGVPRLTKLIPRIFTAVSSTLASLVSFFIRRGRHGCVIVSDAATAFAAVGDTAAAHVTVTDQGC